MKSIKRILAMALSSCLILASLAGCGGSGGSGAKASKPDEYVKACFSFLITGDEAAAKSAGISDADFKVIKENHDQYSTLGDQTVQSIGSTFKDFVNKDDVTNFTNAFIKTVAKIPFTVTTENESGSEASVKLSCKAVDFTGIVQNGINNATAKADVAKIGSGDQAALKDFVSLYFTSLTEELNNYKFPEKEGTCSVKVKKNGDSWTLADATSAINDMGSLTIALS